MAKTGRGFGKFSEPRKMGAASPQFAGLGRDGALTQAQEREARAAEAVYVYFMDDRRFREKVSGSVKDPVAELFREWEAAKVAVELAK